MKDVLSQRRPRDAPTKVNKQPPHLHLRSRDSRLTQFNHWTGRYGRGAERTFYPQNFSIWCRWMTFGLRRAKMLG